MNKFSYKVPAHLRGTFSFPKPSLEIHKLISSNFPQTFFVGGSVRNALLKKKFADIDIATSATPEEVKIILKKSRIKFTSEHEKFGVIIANHKSQKIEITTFRKDTYEVSRYPIISFVKEARVDSRRRDFTINALYYSYKDNIILDFHDGLADIESGTLRFIGNPQKRIEEDPLRIVRAHRFAIQYNLKFENKTATAIQKNNHLVKKLSATRVQREINSVASINFKKQLQKVIHNLY